MFPVDSFAHEDARLRRIRDQPPQSKGNGGACAWHTVWNHPAPRHTPPCPDPSTVHNIIYAHGKAIGGQRLSSGNSFGPSGSPRLRSLIWHNRVTHAKKVTSQGATPPREGISFMGQLSSSRSVLKNTAALFLTRPPIGESFTYSLSCFLCLTKQEYKEF